MDSITILAALRNLRRIDLRWTVSQAKNICSGELGSQLANHLATEKKGLHVEQFTLTVENPLSEDMFEYEHHFEWDAEGQLLPHADLYSDEDESASKENERNGDGEEYLRIVEL
jgi:hypothetical protein